MKPWLRFTFILLLFAGLAFVLGFFERYHLPRIKAWLLVEIEEQSKKHSPVRIWPSGIDIHFFPPRLALSDVKLLPQEGPAKKLLTQGHVEQVEVALSWLALFSGKVRISNLKLKHPEFVLKISDDLFKGSGGEPGRFDFDILQQIPVDELQIENLEVDADYPSRKAHLDFEKLNFTLTNRFRSLQLDLEAPKLTLITENQQDPLTIGLETRLLLEEKELSITAVKIKKQDSFLVGAGRIDGDFTRFKIEKSILNVRTSLFLPEINDWVKAVDPKISIPKMQGRVTLDLGVVMKENETNPEFRYRISSEKVMVAGYNIDQIHSEGVFDQNRLETKKVEIRQAAGLVDLQDVKAQWAKEQNVFAKVVIHNLELGQLLESVKVKNVPLHLNMKGESTCIATFKPSLDMECLAQLQGQKLHLHSGGKEKKTIVAVDSFNAEGKVKVDLKHAEYDANISAGAKSKGHSAGVIGYDTGFKISYEADELHFADVANLADLKLEGKAKLKGTTEGDSHAATLDMDLQGDELWLENYRLGQANSNIRYKEGLLNFRQIQGSIISTRYSGNLTIDLPKSELSLQGKIPYADIEDVQQIFTRYVKLPITITGTGMGEIKASGPLQFNRLSYTLNSTFFRGSAAGESFDEMTFNVSAKDGLATTDRVNVIKGPSVITMNGKVTPEGVMDSVITGQGLRLEQSENLERLGLNATGQLDFTMSLRGQLPKPKMELNGRLSKLVLADKPAEDSTFKLKILNDRFEGGGAFIGGVVLADFIWPFDNTGPFKLSLETKKWNFTSLFALLSETTRQRDFETALSAKVDLESTTGGFWNSTGEAQISDLMIRRGALSMSSPNPIDLHFKNGVMNTSNFLIQGDSSFLKLTSEDSTQNNLNIQLNSKLDMALLTLFTPFLADLRGALSSSIQLTGPAAKPNLKGSAFIEKGFVRLKNFPHPFEEIRADLLLSQDVLNINSLRSEFASGIVTGDGRIQFVGMKHVPIDIHGQFQKVSLNVPDGVRSRGSGSVQVKGDYFPYTLAIQYDVNSGDFTREFEETADANVTVLPSTYLPKFVAQDGFQPVVFNIDMQLRNPISVKNSQIDALMTGQLKIQGTPDAPKLTGQLAAQRGGKLFFRGNTFDILVTNVEYNYTPPENPKLYVNAQTRVTENPADRNSRPQSYDIDLIAQGPAKDPKLTMTSQPPLSQQQIVSLLALGVTSSGESTGGLNDENNSQGSIRIGSALIEKPLGKEIKNRLGLDFSISSNNSTTDNSQKVTLSKQLTPKVTASASRSVGKSQSNSAKLEYQMNKNISVIGSFEGQSDTSATQTLDKKPVDSSVLGLDLEYKLQFK